MKNEKQITIIDYVENNQSISTQSISNKIAGWIPINQLPNNITTLYESKKMFAEYKIVTPDYVLVFYCPDYENIIKLKKVINQLAVEIFPIRAFLRFFNLPMLITL